MTEERLSYERQKGLEILMARAGGIAPVTGHAVARLPAGQPDFQKFPFRGCPACFLILKGVVISSHETNRFS